MALDICYFTGCEYNEIKMPSTLELGEGFGICKLDACGRRNEIENPRGTTKAKERNKS